MDINFAHDGKVWTLVREWHEGSNGESWLMQTLVRPDEHHVFNMGNSASSIEDCKRFIDIGFKSRFMVGPHTMPKGAVVPWSTETLKAAHDVWAAKQRKVAA